MNVDTTVSAIPLAGVAVADAFGTETLEQHVLLRLRDGAGRLSLFAVDPDLADLLADELRAAAGRARSRRLGIGGI